MKLFRTSLIMTLFVVFLASCGYANIGCIDGSGKIIKNERNLDEFDKIVIKGSADVYLRQGAGQDVVVETDDNIIEYIITEVNGSTLTITSEESICPEKLNVYITMSDLEKIEIRGSGDVHGESQFEVGDIELSIHGSGDIKMGLSARQTVCSVRGSGDIQLKGKTNSLNCSVHGSGDMKMFDFESQDCSVTVNGSGDCRVNVSKSLSASVNGSGDVTYKGNPAEVKQQVNGSGDITKH